MSHSLVFTGRIRDGATLEETRHNLAEMFKIGDAAVLDRVFSGKPVILRKNLDEHEARKQEMILLMAGAVCEVRAMAPAAPAAPTPPVPVAAAGADARPADPDPAQAPPQAPPVVPSRPARMELSGHAHSAAQPPQTLSLLPAISPPLALAAEPAPTPADSAAYLPAALRGGLAMAPEQAHAAPDSIAVTHHGRAGEGLLDELHAPWDPAFVPDAVRGLSWAGFFAPLLWGSFNGMPLSFLPLIGVRLLRHFVPAWAWMVFYLGFGTFYLIKGRELAWEHKQWRNAEHFNRVQRNWAIGSFAFFLLSMYGLVHLMTLAHLQGRQGAVQQQLARAEIAVMQATTPEAREAAIADRDKLREDFLATIPDADTRERERRAFAVVDQAVEEHNAEIAQPSAAPDTSASPP